MYGNAAADPNSDAAQMAAKATAKPLLAKITVAQIDCTILKRPVALLMQNLLVNTAQK